MSKELTIEDFYVFELIRNCPKCGKLLHYKSPHSFRFCDRNKTNCKSCASKIKNSEIYRKYDRTQYPIYKKNNKWNFNCVICMKPKGPFPSWADAKGVFTKRPNCRSCNLNKRTISGIYQVVDGCAKNCDQCNKQLLYKGPSAKWHATLSKKQNRLCLSCGQKNIVTDKTREQRRQRLMARHLELGYKSSIDRGAPEWFSVMKDLGYNFIQSYILKEQGYLADGYDKEKHIWMEYDTSYHRCPSIKQKDLIRQNNIIKHFEDIGNPLNEFVRVDATLPGKFGIEIVYKGNKHNKKEIL